MQTVSATVELFFLAILIPLFWGTIRKPASAKTLLVQRILILSLVLTLTANALTNLFFADLPQPVVGKLLTVLDLLALYVFFAAMTVFTLFAVDEKQTLPRVCGILPGAFGVIFVLAWIVSVFTGFSLPVAGREETVRTVLFAACFFPLAVNLVVTILRARAIGIANTVAITLCWALPAVTLPLEILFSLPFVRVSAVVSLLVIELFLARKEQYEYAEKARDLAEKQLELNKSQTRIMISQIQPHFLYNSLATIGYVCQKDAGTASRALDAFAEYLRMNLTAITSETTIPFEQELEHIKTYLWLEKMRFEERLNTVFVIDTTDFSVPAISVQPLVENAVKHGLCEKKDGGTLTIRTIEYVDSYVIQIEDDGVGFDVNHYEDDGKMHVGISNVRSRLKTMCNATLEIRSVNNKGTTATIRLPKEDK